MEVATTELSEERLQRAAQAWAGFGIEKAKIEMTLQARAQKALLRIEKPTKIEDVPAAEKLLKELKTEMNDIKETRLSTISRKLEDINTNLKKAEDSLVKPIVELTEAIVAIKKADEAKKQLEASKDAEKNTIRQMIGQGLTNADFAFRMKINKKITAILTQALEKDVKPEEVEEKVISPCLKLFGVADFLIDKPIITPKFITEEDVTAIMQECWRSNPDAYVSIYQNDLKKAFSDYEVQFANKQKALADAAAAEKAEQDRLAAEKQTAEVAAALQSQAVPLQVVTGPAVKDLKKIWKVEMPETPEDTLKVMAAFAAHFAQCLTKLRVTKWKSFTIGQMENALAALKNDDPKLEITGINFIQIDKL